MSVLGVLAYGLKPVLLAQKLLSGVAALAVVEAPAA
jgi:hypothetical protein